MKKQNNREAKILGRENKRNCRAKFARRTRKIRLETSFVPTLTAQ